MRLPRWTLLALCLPSDGRAVLLRASISAVRPAWVHPAMQQLRMQVPEERAPEASDPPSLASGSSTAVGEPDLSGLDFEERLVVLAKQYENVMPISPEERKRREETYTRPWDSDEKFWNKQFWDLVITDMRSLTWPTTKKVTQTLFVSQIAFVCVICLVLFADALFETSIKAILGVEPFSLTIEKILKMK